MVWRQSTLFIWFVVFYLMHPITQLNTAEEGTRGGSGGLPAYAIDLSGFPEFEQMQHEFIQNPDMIVETIHQPFAQIMMSYPDVMRNILLSDPISRQVIDRDPDLASILYDPSIFSQMTEILRHTSVEFIRNLIRIAEGAGGGDGGSSDGGDGGSSGGATQTHPAVIDLSNPAVSHNVQDMNQQSLFSQLGQQQSTRMGVSQTSEGTVGPGEVAELEEMGFPDTRRNIEALALAATEGNIPDAVDRLLGGQ
ncbi:ubiquitin domain-containing protein DSK2b isoform X2 [Lactuca sativa]|uniref:ubiquitin domain-containing protein DSK2b isoform X2 n=1 Tax=Lactuca sativa TaxID=4236 RepID=UPI001C68E6BE|nr:ubiquitin domain-containing protein DSK2b isoform X2 [Lactuca sativa]